MSMKYGDDVVVWYECLSEMYKPMLYVKMQLTQELVSGLHINPYKPYNGQTYKAFAVSRVDGGTRVGSNPSLTPIAHLSISEFLSESTPKSPTPKLKRFTPTLSNLPVEPESVSVWSRVAVVTRVVTAKRAAITILVFATLAIILPPIMSIIKGNL